MMYILLARPMINDMTAAIVMQTEMIRLRLYKSPEADNEEEPESIADLCNNSYEVCRDVAYAKTAAYHLKQRLIVIKVSNRNSCEHCHCYDNATGYSHIFF